MRQSDPPCDPFHYVLIHEGARERGAAAGAGSSGKRAIDWSKSAANLEGRKGALTIHCCRPQLFSVVRLLVRHDGRSAAAAAVASEECLRAPHHMLLF